MDWWGITQTNLIRKLLYNTFCPLIYSSVYLSFTGASMVYISCTIQHIPCSPTLPAIMFLATFSVYNINRKTDGNEDVINHPDRYSFTSRYAKILSNSAIIAYILAIMLALCYGLITALVSAIPLICGILYSIGWIPPGFRYRRLKEIPVVKNFAIAISWASTPALLPVYSNESDVNAATLVVFIFFFISAFTNSIVFDMRDIKGDIASGVRTIPAIFGAKGTIKILTSLNLFFGLINLFLYPDYISSGFVYLFVAGMIYTNFCVLTFGKIKKANLFCDIATDGKFILFGSFIYIATVL